MVKYPKYDKTKWKVHPKIVSTINSCETLDQVEKCFGFLNIVPKEEVTNVKILLQCKVLRIGFVQPLEKYVEAGKKLSTKK